MLRPHKNCLAISAVLTLLACSTVDDDATRVASLSCELRSVRADLFDYPAQSVLVAAHRGYHVEVPENSLSSIEAAIAAGIDIVELDVQVSRDSVPILMHDDTIDRTTTGSGMPADWDLEDLNGLFLLAPDGSITGEKIPTFATALAAAKNRIWVQIDLKSPNLAAILPIVDAHDMWDQVSFYHGDPSVLDEVLVYNADAIVMPIARELAALESLIGNPRYRAIHLTETTSSEDTADRLDQVGRPGWLNSLGEIDQTALEVGFEGNIEPLLRSRPDIIQTDLPGRLKAYLYARGLHWSAIRPCR